MQNLIFETIENMINFSFKFKVIAYFSFPDFQTSLAVIIQLKNKDVLVMRAGKSVVPRMLWNV